MVHAQSIPAEWRDQVNLDLETASHTIPPPLGRRSLSQWIQPSTLCLSPFSHPLALSVCPSLFHPLSTLDAFFLSLRGTLYPCSSMFGHVCPCLFTPGTHTHTRRFVCTEALSVIGDREWCRTKVLIDNISRERAKIGRVTTFNDVRKFVNAGQKWSMMSGRRLFGGSAAAALRVVALAASNFRVASMHATNSITTRALSGT